MEINTNNVGTTSTSSMDRSSSSSTSVQQTRTEKTQEDVEKAQDATNVQELQKELQNLTEQLNNELNPLNMNVQFGFNDDIESMFVTVSEKDTNKLIRKIPSDEAIELMKKMREIVGIIFDKKG